jgi:hypothetical protein
MSEVQANLIIRGFDKTQDAFKSLDRKLGESSKKTKELQKSFENITAVSKKMAIGGGAVFGAGALAIRNFTNEAMQAERVTQTFDAMTKSIGSDTTTAIDGLRKSTRGLVNDTELMKAGNKFMAMGLAENTEEMNKLSEIATKLGSAMGNDATDSMENFALMLANQSILRLDSFGISSGKVRERIEELMNETEGLTREQAFMQATMEQAEVSMAKLGDTTLTNGEKMQAFQARMDNLRNRLGDALIPILIKVQEKIGPIIDKVVTWIEKNPELSAKIMIAVTAIGALVAVIGTLGLLLVPIITAFSAIGTVIAVLAGPIGIIIVLIGVIGATMAYLVLNWQQHWDNIKWAVGVAGDWIGAKFDLIGQKLKAMVEGAKNILKGFGNFFIDIGEGMANSWVKAVNAIIKALNSIQVSIPDWVPKYGGRSFGINIPEMSEVSIPRLAEGGIATKSTLANIGEAGPEAIIPLSKLHNFGVGGHTFILQTDTFVGTEEFAEQMGDKFIDALKRNQIVQA